MNISLLSDDETARTDPECAVQRAENLKVLGVEAVLELCVGPSLRTLEAAYAQYGIRTTGNDIDPRWQRYHPSGTWIVGDAFTVDPMSFDAVVFAPPLTRGCSGRRVDSLRISEVEPGYDRFLLEMMARDYRGIIVLVLPARSLATQNDRREFHDFIGRFQSPYDVVPLFAERRRIRKYVDVYLL